jgi:hypothetical protein
MDAGFGCRGESTAYILDVSRQRAPCLLLIVVSRQLQAVDCDVDGGIVMKEIAVGLCVARGLLSSLSRIPT